MILRRCPLHSSRPAWLSPPTTRSSVKANPAISTAALQQGRAQTSPTDLPGWVHSKGGSVHFIRLANLAGRDGGSGWGLTATQDVAPGTQLIDLPRSCHLTYDDSDDTRLLALVKQVPSKLWGAKLALQVLSQRLRGDASPFATYTTHLPLAVHGLPMFYPKAAIDALEYPPVIEQVKKRGKWLRDFSSNVLAPLPGTEADPWGGARVDINALGWALAVVTSRAFRTRGSSHPAALLPLIDMCNHSFDNTNVEVLPRGSGAVGLVAKRQITAGEPLLLSYGNLSNDFLLLDYGFVVPDNPHDRVQLRFDVGLLQAGAAVAGVMDGADLLDFRIAPWQRKWLAQLGLDATSSATTTSSNTNSTATLPAINLEVNVGGVGHVEPRLIAATRVLCCKDETEVAGCSLERLGRLDSPLSRHNERKVLRTLSGICAVVLSRFSTSAEADVETLRRGTLLPAAAAQPAAAPAPAGAITSQTGAAVTSKAAGAIADGADGSSSGDSNSSESGSNIAEPVGNPLTDDMRLAIGFRCEKKKLLLRAMQGLGAALQRLAQILDVQDVRGGGSKKGAPPTASTAKGFGVVPGKK